MKHLKKIFESDFDIDIEMVKDIILELKDDYPDIKGEFQFPTSNMVILCLFCKVGIDMSVIGDYNYNYGDIEYLKKKNKFISLIIDVSERISDALGKKVSIVNIYDFDKPSSDGYIKIYIRNEN